VKFGPGGAGLVRSVTCIFNDGRSAAWAGATLAGCPMPSLCLPAPGPAAGAPAKQNGKRAMADTAHQDAVGAALDSLSDEIEIARGAQQLASNLVDRVIMEGLAPARRQTGGSSARWCPSRDLA
jgi:hypothetical protein